MIIETFRQAIQNVWSNKLRTFLTMLGIIIGVMAVIVIVGLGNGMTKSMRDSFSALGTNTLSIQVWGHGSRTVPVEEIYKLPQEFPKAFSLVGLGEEDVKAKFPAMYNAFTYGAPPHAGIAPGVDRMVMLLAGEDSIREIIPFPMNKNAQDLMMGAPSQVEQKQLEDVHIQIKL